MFWRNQGQEGDAGSEDSSVGDPVRKAYRQADDLVGKVISELGPRDTLLVMSDHGFGAFGRGVNVNAWLRERGYLALKPGAKGEGEWLTEVDWDGTRAYALGLAGMYLNVRGREAKGIVAREEMGALKQELMEGLGGLRDEDKGSIAIDRVYDNAEVNPGPYCDTGPDLLVGYAPGYRASWSAAQGKAAGAVVEDNLRHWSGDHCVDPRHVSGVLFCNRPLSDGDASIIDVAPTVLELFGVERPGYMEGKSLVLHGEDGKESPGA
jgi:predicted AlkP superfamily phosphohydrolase/phosphomutase